MDNYITTVTHEIEYTWEDLYNGDLEFLLKNSCFESNPNQACGYSEEEQRIFIFREALKNKEGATWVENELKKKKLRAIYSRNPKEAALLYCLQANETKDAHKTYNLKEFINFYKSLPRIASPCNPKIITFGDLHAYIEEHRKFQSSTKSADSLPPITIEIRRDISTIDKTEQSAENEFRKLFQQQRENLAEASESIRYYISKYVYYVICAQVLEFIELLKFYSTHDHKDALKTIDDNFKAGLYSHWTIAHNIANDSSLLKAIDAVDSRNFIQASDDLLSALTRYFVLYGTTPGTIDDVPKLFVKTTFTRQKEPPVQTVIGLSQLKEETGIFPSSSNFANHQYHENRVDAINSLCISDFYGFRIDFDNLFTLLINNISGEEVQYSQDEGKSKAKNKTKTNAFLESILSGKTDVSRKSLIAILAGAKATIESTKLLFGSENLISKEDMLNHQTVNSILNRVGYVDLNDGEDTSFEIIFKRFFEKNVDKEEDISYIEDLNSSMKDFISKYGYSAMPFEIARYTSKKIHASLLTKSGGQ